MNDDELMFEDPELLPPRETTGALSSAQTPIGVGGLSTAAPESALKTGALRLKQLTELKQQMKVQAQARQAAMERAAQMYEQPINTPGMDPGLIALGMGGAGLPASQALQGFTQGMQGMQAARQKLAERDWARKAAAQKIRAESEQQGMTDLEQQYNMESGAGQSRAGLHVSYYDDKAGNRIQVTVDPRTGETTTKNLGPIRDRASGEIRLPEGQMWRDENDHSKGYVPASGGKYDPKVIAEKGTTEAKQEGRVAESKETGKGAGEEYNRIQKSVSTAQNKINLLDRSEELLKDVETNALTPIGMKFAAWSEATGIPLDPKLGHKQAADAIYKQLALESRNPSGGAGMPGAMSDADRDFLGKINPSLANTTEGRRMIAETSRKLAQRDIDVASMMRAYREKHGNTDRFPDELAAWSKQNPLFGEKPSPKQEGSKPAPAARKFKYLGKD